MCYNKYKSLLECLLDEDEVDEVEWVVAFECEPAKLFKPRADKLDDIDIFCALDKDGEDVFGNPYEDPVINNKLV